MADAVDAPVAEADENEEAPEANDGDKEEEEALEDLEEAEEEGASDEAEVDPFELLDEDSEDNEQQQLMYREYLDLTKQIDCQNTLINDMKARSNELRESPCPTRKEKAEYKKLRICLDQENIKLHTMMNRAIQLQNNGSKRLYSDIELATTDLDANMFVMSSECRKRINCPSTSKRAKTAQDICDACNNSDSDSDNDDCCP